MPATPGPTTTPQEWSNRLASLIAEEGRHRVATARLRVDAMRGATR